MKKDNGLSSAFPTTPENLETTSPIGGGISKREYFAGLAMQGLLAQLPSSESALKIAKQSVMMSDALLAELDKQ